MHKIEIHSEPVELFKLLKFEGLAQSGGEAKSLISAGEVHVNGEVETRKRKKICAGDIITFDGESFRIVLTCQGRSSPP